MYPSTNSSISGQQLDDRFTTWLVTPGTPVIEEALAPAAARAGALDLRHGPPVARSQFERFGQPGTRKSH